MLSFLLLLCLVPVFGGKLDNCACDSLVDGIQQHCSDVKCEAKETCNDEKDCSPMSRKRRAFLNDNPIVDNISEIKRLANVEVTLGNVKIRQIADYSFVYKNQVYRPDCNPYTPVMEPGTQYPSFESCKLYYVIDDNRIDLTVSECPDGSIYSHGQGCVETESITEDCDNRSTFFCTESLDPEPYVNDDNVFVFNYIGVEFTDQCAPYFIGRRGVGDRFASIESCADYYTVGKDKYYLATCPAGQLFNRMTTKCEYGLPCYQFKHLCNKSKDV